MYYALCLVHCCSQEKVSTLEELQVEHRKLTQLAEKVQQLRAQNAKLSQDVKLLPELKKQAAELQQQVVQMQHLKQQIQRLQVNMHEHGGCVGRLSGILWQLLHLYTLKDLCQSCAHHWMHLCMLGSIALQSSACSSNVDCMFVG